MGELHTAYKILHLRPGVSRSEIKKAYRKLVQAWHPDRFAERPELLERCEQKMREINWAYEYLADFNPGPATEPYGEGVPPPDSVRERPAAAEQPPPPQPDAPAEEPETMRPQPRSWLPSGFAFGRGGGPEWLKLRRPAPRAAAPAEDDELLRLGGAFALSILWMGFFFMGREPAWDVYYGLLRLVVCASAAYGARACFREGLWEFGSVLVFLAAFLNPVLPVPFTAWEWRVLNIMTSCYFVYVWLKVLERQSFYYPQQ